MKISGITIDWPSTQWYVSVLHSTAFCANELESFYRTSYVSLSPHRPRCRWNSHDNCCWRNCQGCQMLAPPWMMLWQGWRRLMPTRCRRLMNSLFERPSLSTIEWRCYGLVMMPWSRSCYHEVKIVRGAKRHVEVELQVRLLLQLVILSFLAVEGQRDFSVGLSLESIRSVMDTLARVHHRSLWIFERFKQLLLIVASLEMTNSWLETQHTKQSTGG